MSNKTFIPLFIFLLIASCTDDESLNADLIIARSVRAHGGEQALRNVNTSVTEGTTIIYLYDTIYQSTGFKSYEKSPGKSYYVTPITNEQYAERRIFASNGSMSWTQNDGALAPYRQPAEEHSNTAGEDYPYLLSLNERSIQTTYIETLTEDGQSLHRVDYTAPDESVSEVYFNANTWLIHKVRRFIQTSQGRAELIKYYYDYRPIGDIVTPFRTESHFPPREVDLHLINRMQINEPVDDAIFEFPTAPVLSQAELNNFAGKYYGPENELVQISREANGLFVQLVGKPKVPAVIVAKDYIMFRDGTGSGSWMGNIFLKTDPRSKRKYIDFDLRTTAFTAYARP